MSRIEGVAAGGNTHPPDQPSSLLIHGRIVRPFVERPRALPEIAPLSVELCVAELLADDLSDVACARPVEVSDLNNDPENLLLKDDLVVRVRGDGIKSRMDSLRLLRSMFDIDVGVRSTIM